ncbi:MAG TPA: hypothetical protein VF736_06620 [Pyrinomonadaceae bacterium]|jgi:hypothetical protein
MNRRAVSATTLLAAASLLLLLPPATASAQMRTTERDAAPAPYTGMATTAPHEAGAAPGAGRRAESLTDDEKRLLAVAREDRAPYADFLKGPRTGIVRLLPRETYDGKLALRGGGAYYSFARRAHEYGYGSDVELQLGQFSSGFAGADFGFLVDLGDAPLEEVSKETEAVRFMADFKPPSAEAEARARRDEFMRVVVRASEGRSVRGLQVGGWTYSGVVPAEVGHTYALRSINYESSDVLVAFRVLRRDDNGSVVLLWKTLKGYRTPTLRAGPAAPAVW